MARRRCLHASLLALLAVLCPGVLRADGELRDALRQTIGEARDRVFPALVSIRVVTVRYHGGREHKGQSVGSGTILSEAGHVLTNHHVVQHGRRFLCTLSDRRELEAELVGEDPLTDLALLQLDLGELDGPLPVAALGDSDALEIGDHVMAMGSPFSLSRSVSLGIVSNTERVFAAGFGSDDLEEMEIDGQRVGLFTRWIQHDALIHPGNSGGPLVNLAGEVVGINELGGNAMGFAIPSSLARRVTAALLEHGEVPRSFLGLTFKPIRRTGLSAGVLIDSVVLGGPADGAGIEAGDVLLALDGEALTVRFPEEVPLLLDRVAGLPIGSPVELTYRRGETTLTTRAVTEKLLRDVGEESALPAWGLTVQAITPKMARDLGLASTAGVLVGGVRPGGPAQLAEPPIAGGDVLREVGNRPIAGLDDLVAAYEAFLEAERPELLVRFEHLGQDQLTLLEPRSSAGADPGPRELPKAWIGVATQALLPDLAARLGLDQGGFRVTRIYPGSEAAAAGLAVGDVIVGLDGEPLRPHGPEDNALLDRRVRLRPIGEAVALAVLRGGARLELPVVLERTRTTPGQARRHRDADFELTVRELTFFDRDANRWDEDLRGVLVERVDGGGWAGLGGVRPRDVVLRVGARQVRGLSSFRDALEEVKREQPERVVVVVLRGMRTRFQYLEPEWSP